MPTIVKLVAYLSDYSTYSGYVIVKNELNSLDLKSEQIVVFSDSRLILLVFSSQLRDDKIVKYSIIDPEEFVLELICLRLKYFQKYLEAI